MTDDLPLTIKEAQDGFVSKKFSPMELTSAYFERIKKYNSEYNIFLTLGEDEAYERVKNFDLSIYRNTGFENQPLAGIPVAYKDLFLTKGIRTTASSKVLEGYVPAYSATSVTKMENAGAVSLGKTNCDAWAHGASGENSDFGPTKNPWDKIRVPGGSSSGSAAAVAGNLCIAALGTDTGGSVRQPANFCGVVGLKPTYGAISRYGVIAMASSLDTVGVFARSVGDAETVFDVLKGEDGFDSTVKNNEYKPKSGKYKIGIAKEFFMDGLDKEIEKDIEKIKKVYEGEGVEFVEISLPHTKYAVPIYYIVQPAEVSSNLGRFDGIRYGNPRSDFGMEAKRRIMLGSYVLSSGYYDAYYLKAQKVRSKLIADFDSSFERVDAILSPVSPTPAFKLGEKSDDPLQMYLADIYTCAINLAGIPALAIPSGFSKDKLPLGFQLIGPRFSEKTLFGLGKIYEKSTDYRPKIADFKK